MIPRIASVNTPPTFLIEKLRSMKIEIKRAIAAMTEAIPTVVKATGDCNHKQAIPNPKKNEPNVARISEIPSAEIGSKPTKAAASWGKTKPNTPNKTKKTAPILGAIKNIFDIDFNSYCCY